MFWYTFSGENSFSIFCKLDGSISYDDTWAEGEIDKFYNVEGYSDYEELILMKDWWGKVS